MRKIHKIHTHERRALIPQKASKRRKTRLNISIDKEVSTRLDELPFSKSKLVNSLLRWFLLGEKTAIFQVKIVMGPGPGFEPGLGDPQSPVLTRLHHPGHAHFSYLGYIYKLFAKILLKRANEGALVD